MPTYSPIQPLTHFTTMPAHVHSTAAIEAVQKAYAAFGQRVEHAVAMLDTEIRRVQEWLEHDCPRYWKQQVHRAHEQVARAQADLHRCLMFPIADERPACREERAALKRAQDHLARCEEKLQRVKHWTRQLREAQFEYDGRMNKLARVAEHDVARGVHLLTRLIERVEEYQALQTNQPAAAYDGVRLAEELFADDQPPPPHDDGEPEVPEPKA